MQLPRAPGKVGMFAFMLQKKRRMFRELTQLLRHGDLGLQSRGLMLEPVLHPWHHMGPREQLGQKPRE